VTEMPTRRGRGTTIVARLIERSNGAVHFDWRAGGLVCELLFKL